MVVTLNRNKTSELPFFKKAVLCTKCAQSNAVMWVHTVKPEPA